MSIAKKSPDSMLPRNRPRLRTLELTTGDRHASWLELFFDLVFVLAVTQVARVLSEHMDLASLVKFVALFAGVWWSWIGFTFYADRFETEDVVHRLSVLAGMLAVASLSISLGNAFTDNGDTPFIICCVLVRVVIITLYLRAGFHIPLARSLAKQYALGLGTSSLLLLASLLITTPPVRYAVWAVAFAVELLTPLINPKTTRALPIDRAHVPERFGLFTIIVLGEAVIAAAMGAAGVAWTLPTIFIASIGFAMAATVWWINFDFVQDSALRTNALLERFVYIYGHYFIVASIVAIGIGVEHAIKETNQPHLNWSTTALLAVGCAVYLSAITITRLVTGACKLVYARVATITLFLSLLYLGRFLPPIVLMGVLFLLLSVEVWVENYFAGEESEHENSPHLTPCDHAPEMTTFRARTHDGCEECRKNNYKWVHLRLCLSCGHVGCCDTSVNKHATKHHTATGHPIIASLEKDESWSWCYVDERFVPIHRTVQG